ncbi:hypothetical protein CBL_11918 [Carabus blaptoides fortunei]
MTISRSPSSTLNPDRRTLVPLYDARAHYTYAILSEAVVIDRSLTYPVSMLVFAKSKVERARHTSSTLETCGSHGSLSSDDGQSVGDGTYVGRLLSTAPHVYDRSEFASSGWYLGSCALL